MPPAIPDKIACDTEQQLQREINDLKEALDREETEDSWELILRALARFKAVVRGGAYKHDSFVPSLKPVCKFIVTPILSERGRLLAVAVDLVATLATTLGKRFDPLMQPFAIALLKLCQRPNKVVLNRAQGCLVTVIKQTRLASIIPFLRDSVKDKSAVLRVVATEAIYLCITTIDADKLANKVNDLELIIKMTGRDANPEVRKQGRAILVEFGAKFPDRMAAFINPLTPVTRKNLEVQKFADLPLSGAGENLAAKLLAGPQSRPRTVSQRTHSPEPQPARPSSAMRHAPRMHPPAPSHMDPPPRPHSSAAVRPRIVAAPNGTLNTRPLSAHIVGHTPFTQGVQTDGPSSAAGERDHRLELRRQQSRDYAMPSIGAVAFPTSTTHNEQPESHFSKPHGEQWPNYRERQRSTSVTNGQRNTNKAMDIVRSTKDSNATQPERHGSDQPPRPPSAASDRAAFVRPKSVLSTRSNGHHAPPTRPISATSDTLEQFRSNGIFPDSNARPKSPLAPQRPTVSHPDRPVATHVPNQSRAERPAVVYIPSTESDTVPRPRAQKTWSLRHQMELLNKRKMQQDAKPEDAKPSSLPDPEVPISIDPPNDTVPITPTDAAIAPVEHHEAVDSPATVDVMQSLPKSPVVHKHEPALDKSTGVGQQQIAPLQPIVFPTSATEPEVLSPVTSVQIQTGPVNPSSAKAPKETIDSSKGSSDVDKTAQRSATPVGPRSRTVSSSSTLPVRAPSRSANTQSAGFVPKRTVKSSITQPTKSQAARAQAVMNEKSAAAAKAGTGPATSTSGKSSQVSINRNVPVNKNPLTSSTSGFKPSSKTAPLTTTTGANARTREGPRKPAVPTVSSLVKTHAARREAGLATVKIRLGGAPAPSSVRQPAARSKLQAAVSSKKVIRSVEANASKHVEPAHAKQTYMTASNPASSDVFATPPAAYGGEPVVS